MAVVATWFQHWVPRYCLSHMVEAVVDPDAMVAVLAMVVV